MNNNKMNTIMLLNQRHNFRYKYSLKNTVKVDGKVILAARCVVHGDFKINLISHMNGKGCPVCEESGPLDEMTFVRLTRRAHGKKYTYYLPKVFTQDMTLRIKCPHHGDFTQNMWSHLHGQGCVNCARGIRSARQFRKDATKKHKGKYTYPELTSGNVSGDVVVECPIHGKFRQNFQTHLTGGGCRNCTFKHKWFYIYCFKIEHKKRRTFYKLGLTDDVVRREKEIRRGLKDGYSIELLTSFKYKNEHGAFTTEFFFLSNVPGEQVGKDIVNDGATETKDNGLTPEEMLALAERLDRKYRRTHAEYVPTRQLYSASTTGKKRMADRRARQARQRR